MPKTPRKRKPRVPSLQQRYTNLRAYAARVVLELRTLIEAIDRIDLRHDQADQLDLFPARRIVVDAESYKLITPRIFVCEWCRQFFKLYRCNAPNECDCPKCQGMCECHNEEE